MLITKESHEKWLKDREVQKAKLILGNVTVDENFIKQYATDSVNFINKSADDYNTIEWGQSQSALNSYNNDALKYKYKKVLIDDYLSKNAVPGSYDELSKSLEQNLEAINTIGSMYNNLHSTMSQYKTADEYNFNKLSTEYADASYDDIKAAIQKLTANQRQHTTEESVKAAKTVDILNSIKYTKQYRKEEDYDKAISDLNAEINVLENQLSQINKELSNPGNWNWRGMPTPTDEQRTKTDELNAQINVKKTLLTQLQSGKQMAALTQNATIFGDDYTKMVADRYKQQIVNPTAEEIDNWYAENEALKTDTSDGAEQRRAEHSNTKPQINDPLGLVLQNPDMQFQYSPTSNIGMLVLETFDRGTNYHWNKITEKEKNIYYHILGEKGKDKALEYLKLLEPQFGQRYAGEIADKFDKVYDEHGLLAYLGLNAFSVPFKAISGVGAFVDNAADYITLGEINPYSNLNTGRIASNAIRNETAKDIEENTSLEIGGKNILSEIYNIGMSVADSAIGGKLMGPAFSFVLGNSAASDMAEDIYNRGGTANQIFWGSFAAGASEVIAEKIAIEKLFKNADNIVTVKDFFKSVLAQGTTEGLEETVTEITNKIVDEINMGEKSSYNLVALELMKNNPSMSAEEAYKQAFTECISDVVWSFVGGFASGGMSTTAVGGINIFKNHGYVSQTKKTGKAIKDGNEAQSIIDYAKNSNNKKLVDMVKDVTDVKNVSNMKMGEIYNAVTEQINNDIEGVKDFDALSDYIKNFADNTDSQSLKHVAGMAFEKKLKNTYWGNSVYDDVSQINTQSTLLETNTNTSEQVATQEMQPSATPQPNVNASVDSGVENGYNGNIGTNKTQEGEQIGRQENNDTDILARRTVSAVSGSGDVVRQQSENTQKLLGWLGNREIGSARDERKRAGSHAWLGESEGTTANSLRHGEGIFGNLRRKALKPIDSVGRKLSEELQNKLSDTCMKNEDGTILSLFHWTDAIFDVFEKGDIGFHFGTLDAANARRINKEKDGKAVNNIYKEVYLNIKNPAFIDGDPMTWSAFSTGYKLNQIGIISDDDIDFLKTLDGFYKGNYDSEASSALREIVQQKGYDGIVYTNLCEGDFSVIAFNADQIITVAENGVLKENSGVSEADLDNESAFSSPESDQGGFSDVEDKEIYREKTTDDIMKEVATGQTSTPRQKQVEAVAELFGMKIMWDENITSSFYNFNSHYIFMNPKLTLSEMYVAVFKHELVHHLELKKGYDSFKKYLFDNSPAFAQFCYNQLEQVNGEIFSGTVEEAINAYVKIKYEQYKNSSEIPIPIKSRFTMEMAEMEVVADFVGERLLFGRDIDASMKALTEIAQTDRNIFQRIWDWIKDQLAALKKRGNIQDKSVIKDLEYLDKRLARVWDSKNKKNSTPYVEVKYSIESLSNGRKYVRADRQVIHGNDVSKWGAQVTNYINKTIRDGKNVTVYGIDGDALTITRDTAGKAQFRNYIKQKDGSRRLMTDEEYAIKLRAESHIDELSKVSRRGKKDVTDTKNHPFAKDGFNYRTAYFMDNDGKYYRITLSVGKNGEINTVYNVGKIKETERPLVAQRPNRIISTEDEFNSVSNNSISNSDENVKFHIGINIDENGEVDILSPSKPTADERSSRLIKRFGEYANGEKALVIDMQRLLDLAENGNFTQAYLLAEKISSKFKVTDMNEYQAILRYLNNAIINRQIEYSHQKRIEKFNQKLERQNKKIKEQQAQIRDLESKVADSSKTFEEMEKKRLIREDRSKNLLRFRKVYNRLDTRLYNNSDAKHIPEHLKKMVGSFLDTFKFGNISVDGKTQRRRLTRKDIGDFKNQYEATEFNQNGEPNMAYDESIKEFLGYLYAKADESEKGLLISDLDIYDVLMLSNVADNIWQMVKYSEETFREGKAIKFSDLARQCISDLKAHDKKKNYRFDYKQWFDNLTTGNITPPYFFKQLGKGFYKLYTDLVKGQNKWAFNTEKARVFVEKIKEQYNYSEWKDKTVTFHTERGQNIELTVEQAMQLYATVTRQLSNRKQDAQHLNIGGIVLEDSISSSNWKKIKADLQKIEDSNLEGEEKTLSIEKVWNAFYEDFANDAIQLTLNDLLKVGDLLNDQQKGYTTAWVNYLSNNMAVLGNETSMLLFGYEKFIENNYIPYNSAENYLYSQPGAPKGDERIKHLSFTKNTQIKAATPLVLSSLSEVCAAHVDKMCMYNALAVPLENLNKVFNCTIHNEEGTPTENIKNLLVDKFGAAAVNYMKNFIQDVNGSVRSSSEDSTADAFISLHKKGAVLASLSVVVQQPSAIFRAMAYINPKYFLHLNNIKDIGNNYEQMCKYVGVAIIKKMGGFDTNLGVSTTKWLLGEKTLKNKIDDKMSWLTSKADEITWGHLWATVKAEVSAETDLKVGSKEFFERCAERVTEVINFTQVYDSTLTKSQHMRDKSAYKKMLTAFMAEPTVTYNMLIDALYRAKNEGESGKKFATRAGGAVLASIIANVLLKSIIYAARDDDDDKSYLEKYAKSLTENFAQEINPLNLIPFVKDIVSIWQGYDIERADVTMFDDLISTLDSLSSEKKSTGEKLISLAESISTFFGIPLKNVVRDIKATANVVSGGFDFEYNKTSGTGIKYAIKEGVANVTDDIFGPLVSSNDVFSYYDKMVEAAEEGDEETYMEIYSLLLENGTESSDVLSSVKSSAKESNSVKNKTEKYLKNLRNNSTYNMLDEEDRKKLKSKIKEALSIDLLDAMIPGSDAQYDKLYQAKRNNSKQFNKLREELMNSGIEHSEIELKLFMAELRYLESKNIDIHEWALAELAKSKKYADTDGSGGVSKKEVRVAINKMDVDQQTKRDLWTYYYNKG